MTDKDLGTAAGDIFAKAFTLGYETGREYVPVGGRVLTAELVEDVEALVATANPYSAPAARLRALFPATEPAAEVKPVKFRKMTPKYATANFGFPDVTVDPFTPFTRWAYKDSDGDKWAWNGDQWELHIVPPSPAEPAEEETKAEHNASVARREALGRVAQQLYEQSFDGCDGTFYHDFGRALEDFLPSQGWTRIPASSPVVPAPTETEWQTWQEVPEGVKYSPKARPPAGSPLRLLAQPLWVNRGGTRYQARSGTVSKIGDVEMFHYAPFVAAKEG